MTREAFEAHIRSEFPASITEYLRKDDEGTYFSSVMRIRWRDWQAATAHARDVAAEIVLHELDGNGQAEAINIAIKEALK